MIRKSLFLLALPLLFALGSVSAQTQFWSDTFEDNGAPSSGTRTPSVQNFYPATAPYTKYFCRTAPGNLSLYNYNNNNGVYTGFEGAKIWAGEDIDAAATGTNFSQDAAQSITWKSINISGKSGFSFKGLFACNNAANTWENGNSTGNVADNMGVSYRIDEGAWKDLVRLYGTNGGQLALETTGDEVGDGTPLPSYQFTELGANITGTGTTLELRFSCYSNGSGNEELAIDNFRLFYATALPVSIKDIKVSKDNTQALLNWTTASELNNKSFIIYRSGEDKKFVKIGEVSGNGTTATANSYTFADRKPLNGSNYYKLVQVDMDGRENELGTKSLDFVLDTKTISLYPNPASDKVMLSFAPGNFSSAKLIGNNGKVLKTIALGSVDAEATIDISVFAKGIYFIEFNGKSGKMVEKLIKQ